ncbi:MAG: thioredoxin family protein [Saprospiraceae bacterium]|nr:thioredoxin family protein [Saprospiraceae bacterium]
MKLYLLIFGGLLFFSQLSHSQTNAKPGPYKATHEGWLVNLDEAYALSKKTGKPILANFTGSDWCGWCKRLSAAVFVKDEFKTWAKKNVILLELDFPRSFSIPDNIRTQNANLQQSFGVRGYPTVYLFDIEKDKKTNQYSFNALGKTGYTPTSKEFTDGVNEMLSKRKKS